MLLMERLANNIGSRVALELKLDKDKKEVISYGAFALIQMFFSILIIILFGLLFHVVFEALIISFTGAILRKYSGGVHASSPGICTLIGTVVCIVPAVFLSDLINYWVTLNSVIIFGIMIFIWAYYLIYILAPVDNIKKPMKSEEKRKRMKKGSIVVLSLYLIFIASCLILYTINGEKNFLVYPTCIYSGILWQVFTLTGEGHSVVGKIDNFLNNLLVNIRR